jgi:hypothetical protein
VVSVDLILTIQDLTDGAFTLGQTNPATIDVAKTLSFDVIAVTDAAPIFAPNQTGVEDSDNDISFSGLLVVDVDNDGSETLTMQMLGVPTGAILFWDSGSGLQQLVNSGGTDANGYTWTFEPDQLSGLVLRPPADFAGDFELTLQSTSMELSTLEVVTVTKEFTVAVSPDADDAYFYNEPQDASATEGNIIEVDVFARTQEVNNPNETVVLSIVVDIANSDASALDGLVGIRTPDGKTAGFLSVGFNFVAVIATTLSELENFEFIAGSQAHGSLAVQINIGSKDSATVNGVFETDITSAGDFQSKDITIEITPEPDAPILTLTANNVVSGEGLVPLGLSVEEINPAAGEQADILISGLPQGVQLSGNAVAVGANWIVAAEDVDTLAIQNADAASSLPFSITIEARSTLNGVTVLGAKETLAINVDSAAGDDDVLAGESDLSNLLIGGIGDDSLTGGNLDDTYLFREQDLGIAGDAAIDTITNFAATDDHIDLSDINIANVFFTSTSPGDAAILEIYDGNDNLTGSLLQSIELTGVTIDELNGDLTGAATDAQILNQMQQDNVLLTG